MSRLFLAIPLMLVFLAACSKVDQAHFEKIKIGMSQQEVLQILGEPTVSDSMDAGFVSGTRSVWREGGAEISVTFLQDEVQMRSFGKVEVKQQ